MWVSHCPPWSPHTSSAFPYPHRLARPLNMSPSRYSSYVHGGVNMGAYGAFNGRSAWI